MFQNAELISTIKGEESLSLGTLMETLLVSQTQSMKRLFNEFNIQPESLAKEFQEKHLCKEESQKKMVKEHPLARYGRDLTYLALNAKLGPIIGREKEILDIARILTQHTRSNPILLGDPGVGKTAIIEGLAIFAASQDAPESIKPFHFVEITISALISGASFRGQFEERLEKVIKEAKKDPYLVLFIDELHTIMKSGAIGGTLDVANILKPALSRGEIHLIGATTVEEYREHIEPDGATTRRFQAVWIDEPSQDETIEILIGLIKTFENHHKITIPEVLAKNIAQLSSRFLTDGYQPDKAIMVLDEACARKKLQQSNSPTQIYHSLALSLEDIGQVISKRTKIPIEAILIREDERLLSIEETLSRQIIGQPHAISALAKGIRLTRAGLKSPHKPSVFLFAGPTGTGKTALAKALSKFLFFSDNRLITVDMSEYQLEYNSAKLLGAPPGYIGYGEESHLIREIRQNPHSVVLLDEIEKAHPDILSVFLQVFDEGRLTDARGREINFSEAIFILTSNLGTGKENQSDLGFNLIHTEHDHQKIQIQKNERSIRNAITQSLRPEVINRIDEIVVFHPLSREAIYQIIDIYTEELNHNLAERQIEISISEKVKSIVAEEGFNLIYGARHLRRAFEQIITAPLSNKLIKGEFKRGCIIYVDSFSKKKIIFGLREKVFGM
jgi:ATP-dependent Clp protease ATP-binding subunit ClpC